MQHPEPDFPWNKTPASIMWTVLTDRTGIKINQIIEARPVWSDQTNQVSRHPSWPGGLLNHTKSVPNISDFKQKPKYLLYSFYSFPWWKNNLNRVRDIYSISLQSPNLCLRSNQSWPHSVSGVPPLEMSRRWDLCQQFVPMSPILEECSQSLPSVLCSDSDVIKSSPHPSQAILIIGTMSGTDHCVWPSINMSGLNQQQMQMHHMQIISRCYRFHLVNQKA